ncbi:MAG TPA: extracellular solute-binding protein [Peptococcaceae bacterium]|nr:extracellular solute-binding protein [Peptococcaceae bacterium]
MKKILAVILALAMMITLFAGCAGGGAKKPEGDSKSGDKSSTGGGKSFEYTAMWSEGEPHSEWLKGVISQYEKQTGGKVKVTFVGRDVLTKIRTRILSNDPPDLVDQDGSEISGALLKGGEILAEPMDDFLNGPGPDGKATFKEIYNTEILNLYQLDNKVYFVPYVFITSGFYYDKTLFEKVGVEPPETWEEFVACHEAFEKYGVPFLGADNIGLYNAYYYYWAVQRVMGSGKFYEAASDKTGQKWTEPGYLEAAKYVSEMSARGKHMFQDGYEGAVWPAAQNDFAMGKMGALLCGTWIPNEVKNMTSPDFKWGFFPFPTVPNGKGQITDMEAYLIGWAVPKGAKNADGAKEFMKIACTLENANAMVKNTINMSPISGTEFPDLLTDVKPYLDNAKSFHKSYDGVQSDFPEWWSNVFYPINDELFLGKISPEEFIEKLKTKTAEFYANK